MVEKYLGPACPFERAESEGMAPTIDIIVDTLVLVTDVADGIATASGDLQCPFERTLQHLPSQVQRSTYTASSCSDFRGSPSAGDPLDLGENIEGSDKALVALLEG